MTKIVEFVLHIIELFRERPGHERPVDLRVQRHLTLPVPEDSGCYPFYRRLDDQQLVDEDDFR
ncbi:MAG TPA: hypothetical protein VI248_05765 [Kineosporiaceae bacterium]